MGKSRNAGSLRRKKPSRDSYDVVLIVCEDEKTEPTYFKELRKKLGLSTLNIRICGKECGSAPKSVVKYALKIFKQDPEYNRIFCVFDKDQHTTFQAALDIIRDKKLKKATIEAITSNPCFEQWILLHFEYNKTPRHPYGRNNSACDQVVRDIKKHVSDYEKVRNDVFDITYPHVKQAIKHAEMLERHNTSGETDDPSTKVHHLVKYLQLLKSR